jgi:hypothetical protein
MEAEYVTHKYPAWRDTANFVIVSCMGDDDHPERWEQLWARQLAEARFVICCIPFTTYGIALGDEVVTDVFRGKAYVVSEVARHGGHCTYRIWFGDSENPAVRENVMERATELGCLVESFSQNIPAIDADGTEMAEALDAFLRPLHESGDLLVENG